MSVERREQLPQPISPIRIFIEWARNQGAGVEAIMGFHLTTDFYKQHPEVFAVQFKDLIDQTKEGQNA